VERPDPRDGARNLIVVTLDSLRYDSWVAARPTHLARLGDVERRWSYASWTAPSHYNLLMGLFPHTSPHGVYASEYYKRDYVRYAERLGVAGVEFRDLLPSIFLPTFLRSTLGYDVHALVSMPVLNPKTPLNASFDSYELMSSHNNMSAMFDRLRFGDRPAFHLLNVGETHYPYALPDEDPAEWPRLSGAHGALRTIDDATAGLDTGFFDEGQLAMLRDRQIRAVSYIDGLFEKLYDIVPANTWIVVTSDHGELFGEDGYFGHGPVQHEKVFEVPFVEGMRP
jgi:hypothetical protein